MNRPRKEITFRPELYYNSNPKILYAFSKDLIQAIVDNDEGVVLPKNIGTIFIQGEKRRSVDFKNTKLLGYTVFHQNYHTEGYKFTTKLHSKKIGFLKKNQYSYYQLKFMKFKPYHKLKEKIKEYIDNKKWFNWQKKVK